MKTVFFGVVLALVTVVASAVESPVFGYHWKYGIPKAARIKAFEEQNSNQRIVGGGITDISEIPYHLGLIIEIDIFISVCGASLISPYLAVTAGHCSDDGRDRPRSFTVVAGSNNLFSGGQRVVTSDVTMHPDWNPRLFANDIAVLRWATPFTFSNNVQPIALPTGNELSNDFAGWNGLISGFGSTASGGPIGTNNALNSVSVSVITNEECAVAYGSFLSETNVCTSGAGGVGICNGDNGGPLAINSNGKRILVGVSSFSSAIGCQSGRPSGFTRVTSYTSWLLTF